MERTNYDTYETDNEYDSMENAAQDKVVHLIKTRTFLSYYISWLGPRVDSTCSNNWKAGRQQKGNIIGEPHMIKSHQISEK